MSILTPRERLGSVVSGRYRFDRILATGGMSVLFEGLDTRTRRPVALKVLKSVDCLEAQSVARFLQEMRLTAELRHPHVVDVLDIGEGVDGTPYLVMELLHGESLGFTLRRRKTLPAEEVLALALPIMGALATVHDAGVVHRDVKPDNIFISLDARGNMIPKLLDFGIAKALDGNVETCSGTVLGTPEYMAPEQLFRTMSTPATDVFAMGAVLYRCLSQAAPFAAPSSAETLAKLARDPAPLLVVDHVPRGLCAVVDRALARDPSERYVNVREFAKALAIAARDAGLRVVEHPEPVGLPHAAEWLAEASRRTASTLGWTRQSRALAALGEGHRRRAVPILAALLGASVAVGGAALHGNRTEVGNSGSTSGTPLLPARPDPTRSVDALSGARSIAETGWPVRAAQRTATLEPASSHDSARRFTRKPLGNQTPVAHIATVRAQGADKSAPDDVRPGDDLPLATKW